MPSHRVLVVDDETTLCHVIERVLSTEGYEVRTANSGEDGAEIAANWKPDVVLLDIILPGINGLTTLGRIKEVSPASRVVMMTSHASVDTAVDAIRQGAANYLTKPFEDIHDVCNTVREILGAHAVPEAPRPDTTTEAVRPAPVETHRPEVLVVDDEESIRHILTSIFEMHDCIVRTCGSAEEALTLGDWEPEVALFDIVLPGMSGIKLLGEFKQLHPDTEVLMMTSKASADTAVKAIRLGAYDYIKKPFDLAEVWATVQRALEKRNLNLKHRDLQARQAERSRELSSSVTLEGSESEIDWEPVAEILNEFLLLITQELGAERASLMLLERRSRQLRMVSALGFEVIDPADVRIPLGEGLIGAVAESGDPFVNPNPGAGPMFDDGSDPASSLGDKSIALSVPIRTAQALLGVISLSGRRSGEPFGGEHVSYLAGMAGQLAATIDGTRRAGELQRAYESLKAAQDQLVFSERLKAVGQMAAGVAHDFNNVLSVILARAQFVVQGLQSGTITSEKILQHGETMIKTALQGAEAIKRVQNYTRIRKDVPNAPVDMRAVVQEALEIAKPKWKQETEARGARIEIETELAEVPPVSGNQYELIQVFGNLIFNAVEAMPDGGTLSFSCYEDRERIIAEVQDTGTGMDEETRERLFEPFFTTKESGQGLGMAILFGIVERHGGSIDVTSAPGRGTTFRISLPLMEQPAEAAQRAPTEVHPFQAARVLLVDDDEMVRETYEEALSALGHEVVGFATGKHALSCLQENTFDVMITDLSMQGMTGYDVSKQAKRIDPELRVVLSTGWSVQQQGPEVEEAGIDYVLVKPCMIEDLAETVQQAMRRPVGV